MIDQIFTVYDSKAHAHLPPFQMHRSEQAIRSFTDCVNSEKHVFSAHPGDYQLFHHGSFENETAAFTLMANPKSLGNGLEFVNKQEYPEETDKYEIPDEKVSNEPPLRHNAQS